MKVDLHEWNQFLALHPKAHILQSGAWGELKASFGWKAERLVVENDGVQVLFRLLPGGFTIAYVPKGPISFNEDLIHEMSELCRINRAIFLKIEPDAWEPEKVLFFETSPEWIESKPIQPQRTVLVSLTGSEDELLGRMKQKTRYNIRLAEKKGIVVKTSRDLEEFHLMSEITGKRDGFGVHSKTYYQKAMELFTPTGNAELLTAYYEERPVASLIVFALGDMAWYMYGASSDEERNRMPTYLIQWEAMKWAKAKGCKYYDMWGIPDIEEEILEEEFSTKHSHDGLWGVYRFKRGFGGEVKRSAGAWDRIYNHGLYKLYKILMKVRGRDEL